MALIGESAAGPSETRLDFICNQGGPVMATQLASAGPKGCTDRINAAFSLHRFDDYGADGIVKFRFKIGHIVKAHKFDPREQGSEGFAVFRWMGYRKRSKSASMKRIFKRQNAGLSFCPPLMCGKPRELQRALDRFGAAIRKKDAI